MLVRELECLHEAQSLVDTTPDRHVVDGNLPESSFPIDDEKGTVGVSLLLTVDTICVGDFGIMIGYQRVFDLPQASLLSRCLNPVEKKETILHFFIKTEL